MATLTNLLTISTFYALSRSTVLLLFFAQECSSIGCFVCKSYNGSDLACEDTFNSTVPQATNFSTGRHKYYNPCWAEKLYHRGLFPAEYCIKVKGYQKDNPRYTVLIRTCALDSGTLTADTEIVRISSCSQFKFRNVEYIGCVQSCDTDGCNGATVSGLTSTSYFLLSVSLLLLLYCKTHCCLCS